MKKTITIIVFVAVLLTTVSAYTGKVVDASEGYTTPTLTITNNNETITLDMLKGKYVLLTFWASTDGISRVACNEYSAFLENASFEEKVCHLSVNFDKSKNLFNETVRHDKLNAISQFNVQGDEAEKIKDNFNLDDGYNTLLIDPNGRIIATNPSIGTLQKTFSL